MITYIQTLLYLIILFLSGFRPVCAQSAWTSKEVKIHTLPPDSYKGIDASVKIGGLSGICFDQRHGVYYVIADNAPGRFYSLTLDSLDGTPTIHSETRITYSDGPAPKSLDPESIRMTPDGETLIWTDEANSTINFMDLKGRVNRVIQLPPAFQPGQKGQGIYENSGLESLAISADGTLLVVACEHMLKQDEDCGATWMPPYHPIRLIFLNMATGQILHELLYYAQNSHGLVDLFWDEEGYLWCLERSWSPLTGNDILVFQADLSSATQLKDHPSLCDLDSETIHPVHTSLVHDFQAERKSGIRRRFDNIEGLTLGRQHSTSTRQLILVSDDNFSNSQLTELIEISLRR